MKKNRRILLAQYATIATLSLFAGMNANAASVTKVGNGDDGADLEVLKPIKSGPIWNAKQKALSTLNRLNVVGVPGLGLLIPELERSDMLLAATNVHPTGEQSGSLEVSDDKHLVYARTFAEPYASTRFFPAAQRLSSGQLVALHIHEALHRSLPAAIRANEDIVMHITMSITSPGASYDRVRQVAGLYMDSPIERNDRFVAGEVSTKADTTPLPSSSKTTFGYDFTSFAGNSGVDVGLETSGLYLQTLSFEKSLGGFKRIGSLAVEPFARLRAGFYSRPGQHIQTGPASFEFQSRFAVEENSFIAPTVRYSTKALSDNVNISGDRDVTTWGLQYHANSDHSYVDTGIFYSPESSHEQDWGEKLVYRPVLSFTGRTGYKWEHFSIGGLFELHNSQGRDSEDMNSSFDFPYDYYDRRHVTAFRILAAGPELTYSTGDFQFQAHYKQIFNSTENNFGDLGDILDRGYGESGGGASVTMLF